MYDNPRHQTRFSEASGPDMARRPVGVCRGNATGAGMCGGSVARYTILVATICLPCADRRVVSIVWAALNINEPAR